MNPIPLTKDQAARLLDIAQAVVVDDLGVCFHVIYWDDDEPDPSGCWVEASFDGEDGRYEFFVTETEGITWDGTQLSIPHKGQDLILKPMYSAGDQMKEFLDMADRLGARVVAGEEIKVELRLGECKLKDWNGFKEFPETEDEENTVPEGATVRNEVEDGRVFAKCVFPELAPKLVKHAYDEPVVAEFLGRRWKVQVQTRMHSATCVTFETKDEPLTEEDNHTPSRDNSHWFGQPAFIQGPRIPHLDGKCAYPLQTRETGWGDCGNENIFVAFDEQGIPCGIYKEASCH